MANFNPYTDFKLDPGAFGGSSFGSGWNPGSGGFSGIGTDSDTWNKATKSTSDFGKYNDPFGLNKDKDKKESPWGDVARFAGKQIRDYAQSKSNQGSGFVGGGGGVFQSGDLTFAYPQAPTIIPGQKGGLGSTIGSIAGAALGTLIAPGIGTTIGGQLGGAVGGAF
tara:strand:+ start:8067 stop:8564 length:498 start_codon:yes stop_codon:yes gene_type:complete